MPLTLRSQRLSLLAAAALTPWLGACASRSGGLQPAAFGPFQCTPRTARDEPPARTAPVATSRESKYGKPIRPLVNFKLCPEGQVPLLAPARPTVPKGNPLLGAVDGTADEFFRAPKADAIRQTLRPFDKVYPFGPGGSGKPEPPPDPPGCNGVLSFGSCYYYGSAAFTTTSDGGGMTMTVERPAYDGSGGSGHSLDEIAVQGGAGNGDIIELGWNVSTSQYNNANPHLFVFHWIGWAPTCYDGCGWQQYSATYFPGMDLGPLVGRQVYVGWVFFQGNWWAWFDNQWLGYFPGTEWHGSYTRNSLIQWFGEVSTANGIPPHTDMGNGLFPTNARAALDATLCDVSAADWVCWYRDRQGWGATFPAYYDIQHTGFGQVRYGGAGE